MIVNTTMWIWKSGSLKGKPPGLDNRRLYSWQIGLPTLNTDVRSLSHSEIWGQILHLSFVKTDPQGIFLALKFPSSINGSGGPGTRVVRWMVTNGSACNAHKHGQTEIVTRWLLRGSGRHSACEGGHLENDKYKIVGWYVTMVRGNVRERTTGQPTIPPHPHQEKDWPNLMVTCTQCVVLFVVLYCCLNSVMLYCIISSSVQCHPVCGIVLLGQEQGVVLFVVLYC
jgi:hypothetical protein